MAESSRQTIEQRAWEVCEPHVEAEGLELVDLEYLREREGWILRLFIDRPGAKVGVEDCALISRTLDKVLDVEDFIPHEYNLEVSSPGLDRPLKKPKHYQQAIGKKVKVKTFGPIGDPPRKNFSGVLKEASPELIVVNVEGGGDFQIPIKDVAKAHLEFEF